MNTGVLVGPVATALDGADLSFYVGFLAAGVVYLALRKLERTCTGPKSMTDG
jgi:hypothetical protein